MLSHSAQHEYTYPLTYFHMSFINFIGRQKSKNLEFRLGKEKESVLHWFYIQNSLYLNLNRE